MVKRTGKLQYMASSENIVNGTNILIDGNKFQKEMNFPYQEGLLLLPRNNNRPLCGHATSYDYC